MWQVIPLHTATQHCIRKGMLDTGKPADSVERMDIPFVCWLLRNTRDGKIYLVDCAPNFDNDVNASLHQPMTMRPEWHIKAQLTALGIPLDKIKALIVTHLHWDHFKAIIDFTPSFPVIVQRDELAWAASSRGKPYGKPYETDADNLGLPFFLKCHNQYELIEGPTEIEAGLNVLPIPGHTKGSQAVLVETPRGKLILANDLVNVLENWTMGILPGNINNISDYHESVSLLRQYEEQGYQIIPGHDFRIFTEMKNIFDLVGEV